MNTTLEINKFPPMANRSTWARLLGVPLYKLLYEEKMHRLEPRKVGYSVIYDRETILDWLRRYN